MISFINYKSLIYYSLYRQTSNSNYSRITVSLFLNSSNSPVFILSQIILEQKKKGSVSEVFQIKILSTALVACQRGNNAGRELRIPRNYIVAGESWWKRRGGSSISKFLDSLSGQRGRKKKRRRRGKAKFAGFEADECIIRRSFPAKICTARNFYCFSVSITIPRRTRRRRRPRVSERRRRDATLLPRGNTRIQLRRTRRTTDTTIFYRDTPCRCLPANNRSIRSIWTLLRNKLGNFTVVATKTVLLEFFKSESLELQHFCRNLAKNFSCNLSLYIYFQISFEISLECTLMSLELIAQRSVWTENFCIKYFEILHLL